MRARFRSISTRRKIEDNGFSFIELLAYMAIAALLILAAIPQFNQYREKAAISNLQSDARNVATTIEADYTTALTYPSSATVSTSGNAATANLGGSTQKLSFGDETLSYALDSDGSGYQFALASAGHAGSTVVVYNSDQGGLQPIGTPFNGGTVAN